MRRILILILLFNCKLYCQENSPTVGNGVYWTNGLTWTEVKEKAQIEGKYIFVEMFATWCKPCKKMDIDVYPTILAGQALNRDFISVKIQIDSNQNDSPAIKLLYATARHFEQDYDLRAVPSFLFFSSSGEILHKDVGGKELSEFIEMISRAKNKYDQSYTIMRRFLSGDADINLFPDYINQLEAKGESKMAISVAKYFIKNYLEKLPETEFLKSKVISFITHFPQILSTSDRMFVIVRKQPFLVDSILNFPGYSLNLAISIVHNEIVEPFYATARKSSFNISWHELDNLIKRKVDSALAEEVLLRAKMLWYGQKKDWKLYAEFLFQLSKKQFSRRFASADHAAYYYNEVAWTLFQYSFNKAHLEQALIWIDMALTSYTERGASPGSALVDTKANILYKLGRKNEAIVWEEKALQLQPNAKSLKATLEKMNNGHPTWPVFKD